METASGKNTLHDTVGIVYQNIPAFDTLDERETASMVQSNKRRRTYISNFDSSVKPYSRQNKTAPILVGNAPSIPTSLETSLRMEIIWMLSYALGCNKTKRWYAWNAARTKDLNPMQKIGYLPNINMAPTSDAVVKKTLEIAQEVAKDCEQQFIIVTFDLAIASKAYKIKNDSSPSFDNIFINLGDFHTELSYFKVNYKYFGFSPPLK